MKKSFITANSPMYRLVRVDWPLNSRSVFSPWQMNRVKPMIYSKSKIKTKGFGYFKSQSNSEKNLKPMAYKILIYGSIVFGVLLAGGKCSNSQKIAHQQFKPTYQITRPIQPTHSNFLKIFQMGNAFLNYLENHYKPDSLSLQPERLFAGNLEELSAKPELESTVRFEKLVLSRKSGSSQEHYSAHSKSQSGESSIISPEHKNQPSSQSPTHSNKPSSQSPTHSNQPSSQSPTHSNQPSSQSPTHSNQPSSQNSEFNNPTVKASISEIVESTNKLVAETQDLYPNLPNTPKDSVPFNQGSYWVSDIEILGDPSEPCLNSLVVTGMYLKEESTINLHKYRSKTNKTIRTPHKITDSVREAKLTKMKSKNDQLLELNCKTMTLHNITGGTSKALYQSMEKLDKEAFRVTHLLSNEINNYTRDQIRSRYPKSMHMNTVLVPRLINPFINPDEYDFWLNYASKISLKPRKTRMALVSEPGQIIPHSGKEWLVYDKKKIPEPYFLDVDYKPNNVNLQGDTIKYAKIMAGLMRRRDLDLDKQQEKLVNSALKDIPEANKDINNYYQKLQNSISQQGTSAGHFEGAQRNESNQRPQVQENLEHDQKSKLSKKSQNKSKKKHSKKKK